MNPFMGRTLCPREPPSLICPCAWSVPGEPCAECPQSPASGWELTGGAAEMLCRETGWAGSVASLGRVACLHRKCV